MILERGFDLERFEDKSLYVQQLVDAGFARDDANLVLDRAKNLTTSPEDQAQFQKFFVKEDGQVDLVKVDAFMHIHAARATLHSYLPVLEARADNADNNTSLEGLRDAIELMHVGGMSGAEIADFMNKYIKISKSFTPHPTEGLSPNGVALARDLVEAGESDRKGRVFAIKNAARKIVQSNDFEASKRANMLDETQSSNRDARIHNKGVNQLDRDIEGIIFEVTGELHDIRTNTAVRSWDLDADGKNNAEGFSMIGKMSGSMIGCFTDLSENLEFAIANTRSEDQRKSMQVMHGQVRQVLAALSPIYDKTRDIVVALANVDPEKREALYRGHYEKDYENLKIDFSKVYECIGDKTRGYDFFQETVATLGKLRKRLQQDGDVDASLAIDDSFRTIDRCGFGLEKLQTRHNDLVYIDMLDKMTQSDVFWSMGILSANDRQEVLQAGKFSELSSDLQHEYMQKILDYAQKNGNRAELMQLVRTTNPLAFKSLDKGGNGYPNQERAYADRLELRKMYQRLFAEGIISDAQKIASSRQKFFADLCNMPDMEHMALYEDKKNLARRPSLMRMYAATSGMSNMQSRQERMPDRFRRGHETLHIMFPASDSERNGGSFARLQTFDQVRKVTNASFLETGVPTESMLGGGGSLSRFGGDTDMMRRIEAQELKERLKDKREKGLPLDDNDKKMLIMAATTMYTEQGRTRRYASVTPAQVRDDFAKKLTYIIQDHLDLVGIVPDHTFIDPKPKISKELARMLDPSTSNPTMRWTFADKRIENYYNFANVYKKDSDGKPSNVLVLDSFSENTGCPHLLPFQNNGARASAGKAGGANNLSALRAIGKDQGIYLTESFHPGFFTAGTAMREMHIALHDKGGAEGGITIEDIHDLVHHPEWEEAIFTRDLIDAGRFNAKHLFKTLSDGDASGWTFDRAMKIGGETTWKRDLESGKQTLVHKDQQAENVTDEQLYLCRIYYDRVIFIAMTEAALTPEGKGVTMKNSLDDIVRRFRPHDNGLDVALGVRTRKQWPSVIEDLLNHEINAPAYAVTRLVNGDIESRLKSGQPKDEVMKFYGDGDPKAAEARFRRYGGSFRAGTMPHVSKWNGEVTFGVEQRRSADMKAIIASMKPGNNNVIGFDADPR